VKSKKLFTLLLLAVFGMFGLVGCMETPTQTDIKKHF